MHLCRPGPWARPGGGMGLEIARLYIAKLNNIAFISNHKVWSIHARVHSRVALRSRQEMVMRASSPRRVMGSTSLTCRLCVSAIGLCLSRRPRLPTLATAEVQLDLRGSLIVLPTVKSMCKLRRPYRQTDRGVERPSSRSDPSLRCMRCVQLWWPKWEGIWYFEIPSPNTTVFSVLWPPSSALWWSLVPPHTLVVRLEAFKGT